MVSITYFFEWATTIAGIVSATIILKKDRHYLGNKMMAFANILIGLYTLCIFTYDVINQMWAVQVFLRVGMISILSGSMMIYFTMQCMVSSSSWFKKRKIWIFYIIVVIAYAIYLIIEDFITEKTAGEGATGNINIQIGLIPLAILVVLLFYFLIASNVQLYLHGIKTTTKERKSKMQIYATGILINILGIIINIFSQFTPNDKLGVILDVLFFAVIAIGVITMSVGFLKPVKAEKTQPSSFENPKN